MSVVMGTQLEGVEDIFGIKRIRSVDVRIAYDEVVTAKVEFLLDEIQAKAILQLCKDGKWRSPEFIRPEVDITTMDSTSAYRTYAAGACGPKCQCGHFHYGWSGCPEPDCDCIELKTNG